MQEVCPSCGHLCVHHREHKDESGERFGSTFWCDERMSRENNDFCGCVVGIPKRGEITHPSPVTFYAVRNNRGEYYRTYGNRKSAGWEPDLENAKLWHSMSRASTKVTNLGHGEVVEFVVTKINVIDQTARLTKAREKALEARRRLAIEEKQRELEEAQEEYDRAKKQLMRLRGE